MFERLGTFNLRSKYDTYSQFNDFIQQRVPSDVGVWQSCEMREPTNYWVSVIEDSQKHGGVAANWHRDCGDPKLRDTYLLVLWANICPTEVRHKDSDELVLVNPSEVILLDNALYEHRRPHLTLSEMYNRFFARCFYVKKEFAV